MRHRIRHFLQALATCRGGEAVYYCEECAGWFTIDHF